MLVVSRELNQDVVVIAPGATVRPPDGSDEQVRALAGARIEIKVLSVDRGRVRLGITAPDDYVIRREPM